jgi:hypothetical protein
MIGIFSGKKEENGAGDRDRTDDIQLGKLTANHTFPLFFQTVPVISKPFL